MSDFDDKLNTVISYWEEERNALLQMIADYLKEEEYEMAHLHQQALYRVNSKLQTLNNIKDKLFDKKSVKIQTIAFLQKNLQSEKPHAPKEFYNEMILKLKNELEHLSRVKNEPAFDIDKTILDETINQLVDKKIKGFSLILHRSDNFLLQFRYKAKVLKIAIPVLKQHVKWEHDEARLLAFERLGFRWTDGKRKLTLSLYGSKEEVLNEIKLILSKIVFECFYFRYFDNQSFIKIDK